MEPRHEADEFHILEDHDGQLHYGSGGQGRPLSPGVERLLAREVLRLAGRIRMEKLVPETREELNRLAGSIGLVVTPRTTAARVASKATAKVEELLARVKELEDIEHWALSEALKIRDAKTQQLRSQRDEEKQRADRLEEANRLKQESILVLEGARLERNQRVAELEHQVAEYEDTRRLMARKNLDLARDKAALANRVKELERENQEVRDRAVRAERGAPVIIGDAALRRRILALEGKLAALEGSDAAVEVALKPYQNEVRHLNALLDVRGSEVGRLRGEVAVLEDRLRQHEELESILVEVRATSNRRADRIDELEQENRRLRDGINRAMDVLEPGNAYHVLREALHGEVGPRLRLADETLPVPEELREAAVGRAAAGYQQPMLGWDTVEQAVNAACSCGGGEPGRCCAACDVWHVLRGRRAKGEG